ncbi:shikimate dehydrogenase [Halochromatium salexigens]|uniref:Shikimate dehydrogenase (NADP(+)) n=1 Tax=Halochromatium salexigens TaxID=49447 RepID=A0AAJ0UCZ9_HALSE|nr:shikimate dehydrogenase [Halochromatium salexigens]MBK5929246.1 shikimate dehydrogenase [Halochromatium salexigens]
MTDQYAVIGNPIAHSKSPAIHAAFAAQTGEPIEYGRILGDPDDFAGDVRHFVAEGGRGLNVTVPFKTAAFELLDDLSEQAQAAGAVNTLIVRDGGLLRGDNTDGVGLLRDLTENHGFTLAGKRVLLLGAGGAARGVLRPLLEAGPAELLIANRTARKAEALAAQFSHLDASATTSAPGNTLRRAAYGDDRQPRTSSTAALSTETGQRPDQSLGACQKTHSVAGRGLDGIAGQRFDLIINATSTGLDDQVPAIPNDCLARGGWVYDLLYADEPTPFCRWGQARDAARVLDGLGMLVEQAAESFWLWRGLRPQTAPVIARLRGG